MLTDTQVEAVRYDRSASFKRYCVDCSSLVTSQTTFLVWQTMDFCNASCLEGYVKSKAINCTRCQRPVPNEESIFYTYNAALHVNFFCNQQCLNQYKDTVKFCYCCQHKMCDREILTLTFPNDVKHDFCTKNCAEYYQMNYHQGSGMAITQCNVCNELSMKTYKLLLNDQTYNFCSKLCFFIKKSACKLYTG